ncbi:Hypothetical predicted protein [Pelobates cultripes]|uniref:Uncharacterized protein n=1 Tax=Pelobates cultripes TaxID=61616 RepID=A0AAD1WHZ1_PELCU|nr:Hypothetical predicted protein [Pelobates cultripes]
MAQQKGKKIPERADKSGFFTVRSAPNRAQGQHEADQDGGGDDTLPLQHSPDPGNLPVTREILRAYLDEMSDKLLNNIQASVTALSKDIQELGERTAHVEHRMGEYAEAHNDLADHVQALEKQLTSAELKHYDLEDRSLRQNLRVRGIPESIMQADIPEFLTGFFKSLIPDMPTEMILLDRAHRVAKPKFLPADAARDTLTHLHYYHRNGTFTHATTPEEGLKALKQWDLPVRKQSGCTTSTQRLRRLEEGEKITQSSPAYIQTWVLQIQG